MKLPKSLSYIVKKTHNHCDLPMYRYFFGKGIPIFTGKNDDEKQGFLQSRIAEQNYENDEYPSNEKPALIKIIALSAKLSIFAKGVPVHFRQDGKDTGS